MTGRTARDHQTPPHSPRPPRPLGIGSNPRSITTLMKAAHGHGAGRPPRSDRTPAPLNRDLSHSAPALHEKRPAPHTTNPPAAHDYVNSHPNPSTIEPLDANGTTRPVLTASPPDSQSTPFSYLWTTSRKPGDPTKVIHTPKPPPPPLHTTHANSSKDGYLSEKPGVFWSGQHPLLKSSPFWTMGYPPFP